MAAIASPPPSLPRLSPPPPPCPLCRFSCLGLQGRDSAGAGAALAAASGCCCPWALCLGAGWWGAACTPERAVAAAGFSPGGWLSPAGNKGAGQGGMLTEQRALLVGPERFSGRFVSSRGRCHLRSRFAARPPPATGPAAHQAAAQQGQQGAHTAPACRPEAGGDLLLAGKKAPQQLSTQRNSTKKYQRAVTRSTKIKEQGSTPSPKEAGHRCPRGSSRCSCCRRQRRPGRRRGGKRRRGCKRSARRGGLRDGGAHKPAPGVVPGRGPALLPPLLLLVLLGGGRAAKPVDGRRRPLPLRRGGGLACAAAGSPPRGHLLLLCKAWRARAEARRALTEHHPLGKVHQQRRAGVVPRS